MARLAVLAFSLLLVGQCKATGKFVFANIVALFFFQVSPIQLNIRNDHESSSYDTSSIDVFRIQQPFKLLLPVDYLNSSKNQEYLDAIVLTFNININIT